MNLTRIFSVFGACTVIALAAAACDDDHRSYGAGYDTESFDTCNQFTTCDTCTPRSGCGWCFDGASSFCGSDANACDSEWTWETNFCRDAADATVATGDGSSSSSSDASTSDASTDAEADADASP